MQKIAICDDDPKHLAEYAGLLEEFAQKHHFEITITEYTSGEELLFAWEDKERQADALFLDIHMERTNGLEVANRLRDADCNSEIIFLTRDRDKMLDAFDVSAFHYVMKEVTSLEKIEQIFVKLINKLENKKKEYITFSCAGENRNILIDSIKYFRVDVRVMSVYYGRDESFEFYSTIGKIENALCAKGFQRIYRSILINTAYVKSATPTEVIMMDGTELPVGRSYWKELKEELAG